MTPDNPYETFKVGDIIREMYTENQYLVLEETVSERTGHTTRLYVKNLGTGQHKYLSWLFFDNYKFTA